MPLLRLELTTKTSSQIDCQDLDKGISTSISKEERGGQELPIAAKSEPPPLGPFHSPLGAKKCMRSLVKDRFTEAQF
jgi:hypothetical protein